MKLAAFERRVGFEFALTFDTGERITVDLEPLIGNYISTEELSTGEIDPDWGCLQFQEGNVDIEPVTLYRYAMGSTATTGASASAVAQPVRQPDRQLPSRR